MFVCSVANALGKIALDSLIQNDVAETLRSSAFARSETFLQLAWVVGAAIAVAVPSTSTTDGSIGLGIDAVVAVRGRGGDDPAHPGDEAAHSGARSAAGGHAPG